MREGGTAQPRRYFFAQGPRHLFVHRALHISRNRIGKLAFDLGLQRSGIDMVLAIEQRLDPLLGHICRMAFVLALAAHLGVVHSRAMEEVGIGRTGLQRRHRHICVLQFITKAVRKRQHKCLGRRIHRLPGATISPAIDEVNRILPSLRAAICRTMYLAR